VETDHYNGCVLIADRELEGQKFVSTQKTFDRYSNAFVVINPLWNIDFTKWQAQPAPQAMDDGGKELFFRHPMYEQRLLKFSPIQLKELDCQILFWADRFKTTSEIAEILKVDRTELFERLLELERKELVQIQNISQAMAKLQRFYSSQELPREHTLSALWQTAVALHDENPFVLWPADESIFTYKDADTIVRMTASFLAKHGAGRGDAIVIDAISHPEFIFIFWAAVLLGCIAVPLNPEMKADQYEAILRQTEAKLVFFDACAQRKIPEYRAFAFAASEDSSLYEGSFSQQIADFDGYENFPELQPAQDAVILFTSGSTGMPKGVMLSHGALYRSSSIMDHAYGWRSSDRFLGGGSFHTMSGLRNPCLAVLHSGASVVIPGKDIAQNPLAVMNLCMKYQVTILNVTPAFLAYWSVAGQKAKYFENHHLRMVLSTGSALQPIHREAFQENFHVMVYDYYGLTETTGVCILEDSSMHNVRERGIGKPWQCIVKIVDEQGERRPIGAAGELAIYSDNLMVRYLGEDALTNLRIQNGWLMTGDTAYINERGCVVLSGRIDRMMIDKNGENVYPEEIEKVICELPGVTGAYVTQIRDDLQMEHIAALVSFSKSRSHSIHQLSQELSRRIPVQHIPSIIVEVGEIPRNATGKVAIQQANEILKTHHGTSI